MVARSRLLVRSVAVLALLAGAGCRGGPERITIGEAQLPGFGLFFIARSQGYFAAEGVEVAVREYAAGRDALGALLAGEVDAATAYSTPLVARAAEAPDLRVLTMLHWSVADTRVIARRDRGVTTAADLRGKRIGVPRDTSAELFLATLLASAGVRADEVEQVEVAPADASAALVRGELDAIAIWFPHAVELPLPEEALTELRSTAYNELSVFVTRAAVLEHKREALRRVLRALARAEQLTRDRPAVALTALERGLDAWTGELVREGWSLVNPQLGLSNLLLASLERQAEWRRARRGGPIPDFRPLLDAALLLEIDRESVTLLGSE